MARKEDLKPVQVRYKRRDPDLDPQLIWRGKYDAENMDGGDLYLSYIRDRLIVARDLLTDSGSIFVQIGDEVMKVYRIS